MMKRKYTFAALMAFAFVFVSPSWALPGPTSATFAKGAKFTVAGYAEGKPALTGFPVLVRISDNSPSGFHYSDMQHADATDKNDIDIAFVDMNGSGLPFEIDTWDPDGTSLIWVRLPSMQNGTEFVMCWGSSSSGKVVCNVNPWNEYAGVWHLGETVGGVTTVADSTTNHLDGTTVSSSSAVSDAPIGGARHVTTNAQNSPGLDSGITVALPENSLKRSAVDGLGTEFTASMWVRVTANFNYFYLISRKSSDGYKSWGVQTLNGTTGQVRYYSAGTGESDCASPTLSTALAAKYQWHKIDFCWKTDGTYVIFQDGANKLSGDLKNKAPVVQGSLNLSLGGSLQNGNSKGGRGLNGDLDEVRLRAFVPSDDWVAADYATQTDASFLSPGTAEDYVENDNPHAAVTIASVAYTNVTLTANVLDLGGDAASAGVSVSVSTDNQFTTDVWHTEYSVDAADNRSFDILHLVTNTTYHVRLIAENPLGGGVTNTVSFTTLNPGAPSGTALFLERGFSTLSARATATAFGTGAEGAAIRLEASGNGFETIAASTDVAAALNEQVELVVPNLLPDTEYALRIRIRNDWGLDTYIELPSAYTRAVPFATTGIGWTFSPDGSTVDISFGINGIYDGATGSATLTYNGADKGAKEVTGATTLTWPGINTASGAATATVVLSAMLADQTYSQTFSATISPGSTSVAVSDFAEHQSAETSVRINTGDVISLPDLTGTDYYYLGNNRFGSLDGKVLTAAEPGILGVFRVSDDGATTNTLPVIVLPEKIGNGDIYILKDGNIGNEIYWDNSAIWEKVGSESNDSFPQNAGDIAILCYWNRTGEVKFKTHSSADITLGAIFIGGFRDAASKTVFKDMGYFVFSRLDGEPGLLQFCANDRLTAKGATIELQDSLAGVKFPSGIIVDGGWDGVENRCPRAYFNFNAQSFLLPEGTALLLQNFSPSRDCEGTTFGKPFTGGGLVWNRSAANFNWTGEALAGFTGTLRDSSHGAASFDYQAPLFVRSPGSNTVGEVIGFVSANSDANPHVSSSSVGIMQTGFNQNYRDALIHQDPWFTGRGLLLHGGTYKANAVEHVWGYGKADKKIGDVLTLSCGLNFLSRSWSRDQFKGQPINWVEFKSIVHEGKSSLVLWGDFWNNGAVSTADATITIDVPKGGPVITETIPAGSVRTNHVMIISGVSSYAVGPDGDPQATALHKVVPWMLAPANKSGDGWDALAFAAFDENGRLVAPVRAEVASLMAAEQGADVVVQNNDIGISSDVTVNSLLVNNSNKGKTLGEERTLTVTSGGLILHGSGAIGTESGGAANGSLVLGDATHPAYVWARGKTSGPNNLWAKVTALGGFVSAYSGNLVLGGDQTGIGDEIAVNAGSLQLGTAENSCQLAKDLPIRIYANATLKLPNDSSTTGNILKFDGAAGWFGKVEVPEGVAAKCRRAYWRDYPETSEWQGLPRGIYTGDEATARSTGAIYDPDRFAGAGTFTVQKDDNSDPLIIIVR